MSLKLLWRPDKFLSRSVSHLPQYRHLHHPHLQHHYSQSGSPTANGKWVGEPHSPPHCSGRCAPYQVAGFGPDNATMILVWWLVGWLVGWSNICFFCHHSQLFNFYWTWFSSQTPMTQSWQAFNGVRTIWHQDLAIGQFGTTNVKRTIWYCSIKTWGCLWRTYH